MPPEVQEHKACQSHCCARHGCKYSYDDCPVVEQRLEQSGPCEFCPSFEDIREYLKYYTDELTWYYKLQEIKAKKEGK